MFLRSVKAPQWSSSVLAFGRVGARGQESQATRGRPSWTQRSTGSPPGRTDSPAARRNPGSALGADPGCLRAARLDLGPILVARHLFHHLSLGTILDGERPLRRHGQLLSERIFPLRRIVSLVLAVSTFWRNGWKTISYAMLRAVAGCRCGSNPAGWRWTLNSCDFGIK